MEELQSKSKYVEAVLDSMVDSVFTVTQEGVIESINATAAQMFSCTAHQVQGMAPTAKGQRCVWYWVPLTLGTRQAKT